MFSKVKKNLNEKDLDQRWRSEEDSLGLGDIYFCYHFRNPETHSNRLKHELHELEKLN